MKTFPVTLKVIPRRCWSQEALVPVDFSSFPTVSGYLDVNLEVDPLLKGAFKTSHTGFIKSSGDLPSSLSGEICAKHFYYPGLNGATKRYPGIQEQTFIRSEVSCLDWARILLDLTYGFIANYQGGEKSFSGTIPELRFVEAAVAEVGVEKYFLIEEWIDTSRAPFKKYINNGSPVSCIPTTAPEELQNIANFLCFAQHVQYQVTEGTMFTSDYQGLH